LRKKVKTYLKDTIWVVFFFLVTAIAFSIFQTRNIDHSVVRQLSAQTLQGETFDLEKARKPLLIQFWATWCPVCALELHSVESIAKDYPVVTVAMNSGEKEEIEQYMHEHGVLFPVINDIDGQLSRSWQVSGVPASFIIGTDNKVRFVEMGYSTEIGLRLRLWFAGL